MAGVMATFMSLTIAFALRALFDGIGAGFVGEWLRTAAIAFVVAWPSAIVFLPVVNAIVDRLPLPGGGESRQTATDTSQIE
jgi:hypothetical protein